MRILSNRLWYQKMNQDTLQEFKEISETLADAPYILVSKIYSI
jgi:hypothetical protein